MQLDEFVKSTLRQIIHGVRDAQNELGADGAAVNPGVRTGPSSRIVHSTGTILQDVEFDIAVTVSESENSGSGLRVGTDRVAHIAAAMAGGQSPAATAKSEAALTQALVPLNAVDQT